MHVALMVFWQKCWEVLYIYRYNGETDKKMFSSINILSIYQANITSVALANIKLHIAINYFSTFFVLTD